MIPIIGPRHFDTALDDLNQALECDVRYDRSWAHAMRIQQAASILGRRGISPDRLRQDLALNLLLTCYDHPIVPGSRILRLCFGIHLLRAWLGEQEVPIDADQTDALTLFTIFRRHPRDEAKGPSNRLIHELAHWLRSTTPGGNEPRLGHRRRPTVDGDDVTVYLAPRMTTRNDDELEWIEDLTDGIAEVFADAGVLVRRPNFVHNPRVNRAAADDPANLDQDRAAISESDVVVIVHDRPSSGLGVVSEIAREYGVPRIILQGHEPLSPLLIGTSDQPTVISLDRQPLNALKIWLRAHHQRLALRRDKRLELTNSMQPEIAAIREQLGNATRVELEEHLGPDLTVERLNYLLDNELVYRHRKPDERAIIDDLFDSPPEAPKLSLDSMLDSILPSLSDVQANALDATAAEWDWAEEMRRKLELAGRALLVSSPARGDPMNAKLHLRSGWLELYDRLQ